MNLTEFEKKVIDWANAREIYKYSSLESQVFKAMAEMGELADNIVKGKDVRDDIGDIIVCLANAAQFADSNLEECCEIAWNDIKDRTGYMVPGGAFVKDE